MQRFVLKPFTFSNGHTVPAGAMLSCPVMSMHHDSERYPGAKDFNPWRFSDMRETEGEYHKNQLASTNADYIAFGHGAYAW